MKRKYDETLDADYSSSSDDESSVDDQDLSEQSTQEEEENSGYYSDSQIDYNPSGQMIIVLNPTDFHIPREANTDEDNENNKKVTKPNSKKTKLDNDREEILKRLSKLECKGDMTLKDRIIFSDLPDMIKASVLREYEEKSSGSSSSDKSKSNSYVEKVLKIPYGKYRDINPSLEDVPKFMMNLREKLDDAIYGHQETKEEIIDYISSKLRNPESNPSILALKSAPGLGKCHKKNTPIMMNDGSIKLVQDIVEGDVLMGDDSTPRNVLRLGRGRDKMYKITHGYSKRSYTVNSEHILCLVHKFTEQHLEIEVKEFLNLPIQEQLNWKGISSSVEFKKKELDIDPKKAGSRADTKIPSYCIYNDFTTRLRFLSGMVEANGAYHEDCVEIFLNKPEKVLLNSLLFLINSLGFAAKKEEKYNGIVLITIRNCSMFVKHPETYSPGSSSENISIEELEEDEYYGFNIDGNSRFLLGNCIVTHNTKFVRALGKALNLPFQQLSFGGLNDVSILTGHDYTYIGSKPGRIYDALSKSNCMNGIVYLDEVDKIGALDGEKAIQINGVLTHLLDKEQNSDFYDHYIGEIPLDLSKILFIVSFNNEYNVDPVVLNRLKVIEIKDNTIKDKVNIVKKFTIPEIFKNLHLDSERFIINEDIIKYIILNKTVFEKGMRNINKNFNTLLGKMNTLLYLEKAPPDIREKITSGLTYEKITLDRNDDGSININKNIVDKLLKKSSNNESYMNMYV